MQVIANSLLLQGCKEENEIKSPKQVECSKSEMKVSIGTDTEVLQRDCGSQNCGGMHISLCLLLLAHIA